MAYDFPISSSQLSNLNTVTLSLTNTQIKALNVTAVTVVAAQGAGIVIVPVQATMKMIYGGTNAFTGTPTMFIQYGTGVGTNGIFQVSSAGFWTATQNAYIIPFNTGSSLQMNASAVENVAVMVAASSGISGNAAANNTAEIQIMYYTIAI